MPGQELPPKNADTSDAADPNVMPEGQHPPGIDETTGQQSDYLQLISPQAQVWGVDAAAIELPPIEGDGARSHEDSHY